MFLLEKNKSEKLVSKSNNAKLQEAFPLSKICLLIITSIKSSPDDWTATGYRLENEKVGLSLWVGNGRERLYIEGHNISRHTLSDIELNTIWQAYIEWVESRKKIIELTLEQAIGGIDAELFY